MPDDARIEIKPFDGLTLKELHACLMLRSEVFVVGQQICCEADPDALDPKCHHAMVWLGDELVGTARLFAAVDEKTIKAGRVAVAPSHRGRGLGLALMREVQRWIAERPDCCGVMSAQLYLEPWYARLGWVREGSVYMEAGIEHVKMRYTPADAS